MKTDHLRDWRWGLVLLVSLLCGCGPPDVITSSSRTLVPGPAGNIPADILILTVTGGEESWPPSQRMARIVGSLLLKEGLAKTLTTDQAIKIPPHMASVLKVYIC